MSPIARWARAGRRDAHAVTRRGRTAAADAGGRREGRCPIRFAGLDASRPATVVGSLRADSHGSTALPIARLRARYEPEEAPGGYVLWRLRR